MTCLEIIKSIKHEINVKCYFKVKTYRITVNRYRVNVEGQKQGFRNVIIGVSPVTDPGFDLRGAWSTVNSGGGGVSTSLKVLTVVV